MPDCPTIHRGDSVPRRDENETRRRATARRAGWRTRRTKRCGRALKPPRMDSWRCSSTRTSTGVLGTSGRADLPPEWTFGVFEVRARARVSLEREDVRECRQVWTFGVSAVHVRERVSRLSSLRHGAERSRLPRRRRAIRVALAFHRANGGEISMREFLPIWNEHGELYREAKIEVARKLAEDARKTRTQKTDKD